MNLTETLANLENMLNLTDRQQESFREVSSRFAAQIDDVSQRTEALREKEKLEALVREAETVSRDTRDTAVFRKKIKGLQMKHFPGGRGTEIEREGRELLSQFADALRPALSEDQKGTLEKIVQASSA